MTPQKRRLHLIDKHTYPKNFFFAVTKEGIDGRKSLLLEAGHRQRKPPPAKSQPRESRRRAGPADASNDEKQSEPMTERAPSGEPPGGGGSGSPGKENINNEMEGLTGAMSALKFVPRNIRFGRGGRGTGFSRK